MHWKDDCFFSLMVNREWANVLKGLSVVRALVGNTVRMQSSFPGKH